MKFCQLVYVLDSFVYLSDFIWVYAYIQTPIYYLILWLSEMEVTSISIQQTSHIQGWLVCFIQKIEISY